jgi:hypothetical protein
VKEEERQQAKVTRRVESLEQMLRMSTRPVPKLRDSSWESEEEEELAQAEVTRLVTRRLLPTFSSRLVTKLCVSRRRRSERARASGSHYASKLHMRSSKEAVLPSVHLDVHVYKNNGQHILFNLTQQDLLVRERMNDAGGDDATYI